MDQNKSVLLLNNYENKPLKGAGTRNSLYFWDLMLGRYRMGDGQTVIPKKTGEGEKVNTCTFWHQVRIYHIRLDFLDWHVSQNWIYPGTGLMDPYDATHCRRGHWTLPPPAAMVDPSSPPPLLRLSW